MVEFHNKKPLGKASKRKEDEEGAVNQKKMIRAENQWRLQGRRRIRENRSPENSWTMGGTVIVGIGMRTTCWEVNAAH